MTRQIIHRRALLGGLGTGAVFSLGGAKARQPGIAITVDDFDLADTATITGVARDAAIRASLEKAGVKAAGFVAGKNIADDAARSVLKAWSDEGHVLANHTFSHKYYSGADPDGYMADILRCQAVLEPYAAFRKLFRYPYLGEGKTAEGRDALRLRLRDNGYRNGHVTIDTSDWYFDTRLQARLKSDPGADIAPYHQAYLDHMWERATYYDGLAQDVFGHSIDHTILLHHRLTTALFVGDLMAMFKDRGWRCVDAATAFAQPEFVRQYDTLPSGQSLVWAAAKASGRYEGKLRYPGEDGDYEAAHLDALGL